MATLTRTLTAVALALALGSSACSDSSTNSAGVCVPNCSFKVCGDDGCGGSCGTCGAGLECQLFQCRASTGADVVGAPDTTMGAPDTVDPNGDADQDGVLDWRDNCTGLYNPAQADLDGDRIGDPCDDDVDGDGDPDLVDCAPFNPKISAVAPERCGNGVDDNCNSETDEPDAADCTGFYIDTDDDGAGDSSTRRCLCAPDGDHRVRIGGDCEPGNPSVGPLAVEACDDADNNCNLLTDEGCDDDADGYCDDSMVLVGAPAVCPNGGGDCFDYSALVSPAGVEVEGDGLDNDCDGVYAGEGLGPIEPNCTGVCTGNTVDALLCAAEICYPNLLLSATVASPTFSPTSGKFTALAQWGNPSNDLQPFAGSSYAILGTGPWSSVDHDASPGGFGFGVPDPFSGNGEEMFDAVELRLIMRAPPGATGFSLDYIFLSAEYEEFIGSMFNDRFYIVLKAPQTTNNQPTIVNFTSCSAPGLYSDFTENGQPWCYIAVNTAFSEPCNNPMTDISGTGHECFNGSSTGWLTTSWPIQPNEQFELTFHIHDTADDRWNSHVVIDNFRWEGGTFSQGTDSHQ